MLKLIKNKIIQALVKTDAFKNAVKDLAIRGVDNYMHDCDLIDREDLDQILRDVAYDYDLITVHNIGDHIEDFVTDDNIHNHIDDRLKYHDLEDLNVGVEVEKYCEETLSKSFLAHANSLTKHFKIVVKDTFREESNNG